jgi:methionine biosynthesis protein MetW
MSRDSHSIIVQHVQEGATVLDLGCNDGILLQRLQDTKQCRGYGIDIDHDSVTECLKKDLCVYQGDITEVLQGFSDKHFDVVILSQTLQQIKDPLSIMNEMCRVGRKAILTFPNFAHWSCRFDLLRGIIPRTKSLPYNWYDTPNIRVVSIKSFRKVCRDNHFKILKEEPIYSSNWQRLIPGSSNLLAEKGLFVIEKNQA